MTKSFFSNFLMSSNQSDFNLLPIYKLYFDDIEEIFLDKISIKYLLISSIIICLLILISTIMLLYNSHKVFLACLIPFIYSLLFYDFIELVSIVLLKYNLSNTNEKYFGEICRWPYYLKATSEAGQCIALIFLCAIRSQKVRYFLKHNHLPNSTHVHSRVLTFVCVLFIIYVNNWITHLKVEKIHQVTLNETEYEINVQELPISLSLYDMPEMKTHSHQRFLSDLDKYSQGSKRNIAPQNQQKINNDKIIHNHKDDSLHVIIKFPHAHLFGSFTTNRTKRTAKNYEIQEQLPTFNQTSYANEYNNSYRINRCTYGQKNFHLTNFLGLISSLSYFILIIYYLIIIYTHKVTASTDSYHKQFYDKPYSLARKKSAIRRNHFIVLVNLKDFLYLIICSNTIFTLIRLIYVCSLTILLSFVQTPFKLLPVKVFFYVLFLISYFSIPLRLFMLFIYCFSIRFSTYLRSIVFYLFNTKLRFSWRLERPTICFRLQFVPYKLSKTQNRQQSVFFDASSSVVDDQSNTLQQESIILINENNSNLITTTHFATHIVIVDESSPNGLADARL